MGVAADHIWLLDSRGTPPPALAGAESWLSASERARLLALPRAPRRDQFLLGRALLRIAVGHLVGRDPAVIEIVEVPGDAPAVIVPSHDAPFFSLSHSAHWVACVVGSAGPVGLDIEAISAARDVVALSEWRFHAEEHAWLLRQPDRTRAFYALWTGKEAMVKLRSRFGLSTDMADVRFDVAGDTLRPPLPAASWHVLASPPEVATSVVSNSESESPKVKLVGASDLSDLVLAAQRY